MNFSIAKVSKNVDRIIAIEIHRHVSYLFKMYYNFLFLKIYNFVSSTGCFESVCQNLEKPKQII